VVSHTGRGLPGYLIRAIAETPELGLGHLPGADRAACVSYHEALAEQIIRDGARVFYCASGGQDHVALFSETPWDSRALGQRVGRIWAVYGPMRPEYAPAWRQVISAALDHARAERFSMVDLQVLASGLAVIHALESLGFFWTGTSVSVAWDLRSPLPTGVACAAEIREAVPDDMEALEALAERCIPEHTRFSDDPYLASASVPSLFREWAGNSLRGYADFVYVAHLDGVLSGYTAWRTNKLAQQLSGRKYGTIDLAGVAPEARRRNLFAALAHAGLTRMQQEGYLGVEAWTHILNTGIQHACVNVLGASARTARHSFHWHVET